MSRFRLRSPNDPDGCPCVSWVSRITQRQDPAGTIIDTPACLDFDDDGLIAKSWDTIPEHPILSVTAIDLDGNPIADLQPYGDGEGKWQPAFPEHGSGPEGDTISRCIRPRQLWLLPEALTDIESLFLVTFDNGEKLYRSNHRPPNAQYPNAIRMTSGMDWDGFDGPPIDPYPIDPNTNLITYHPPGTTPLPNHRLTHPLFRLLPPFHIIGDEYSYPYYQTDVNLDHLTDDDTITLGTNGNINRMRLNLFQRIHNDWTRDLICLALDHIDQDEDGRITTLVARLAWQS